MIPAGCWTPRLDLDGPMGRCASPGFCEGDPPGGWPEWVRFGFFVLGEVCCGDQIEYGCYFFF
jgi:hypothetical protein